MHKEKKKYTTINSNEMKNKESTQDTHTNIRNGEGEVLLAKTYVEKRRVSFIYFIVDKISIFLSELF